MSLHPQELGEIPPMTVEVAKFAFPQGNIYMRMRDELGVFYEDSDFSSLFSSKGKPAFSPWRLALITVMQYVEGLTDRQAADAVRGRIDWKYALGLELKDSGFNFSLLSDFRSRLIEGGLEQHLFEKMLKGFQAKGLLKSPQKQRTDSTHILAHIRVLLRWEKIGETLRFALQFYVDNGELKLRKDSNCPPSRILINSPYDPEARMGNKKTRKWIGYKVHLSETCDEDSPHLITYVDTKLSSSKDHEIMENLHESLKKENLSPEQHFVDSAYIDTELLISSQEDYEIDLIGPIQKNPQWQAREGKGYSLADFQVDWQQQVVECPHGKLSRTWKNRLNNYQQSVIQVSFKKSDCQKCPAISDCTKSKLGLRTLTLRPQKFQETLEAARKRQETSEFKEQYATRAGVEGTISQGTRAFGLRRCRYLGFAKTRLQHIVTACAINLWRIWEWWNDNYSFGQTISRFASLAP